MKNRKLFFALFAISGFTGLIYESIWTQYLRLYLGHAAYAQVMVLAIFMGGMAVGSYLCSKYSEQWRQVLLGYAAVEGVIGLFALAFHSVFVSSIRFFYETVIPAAVAPAFIHVAKWGIAALLILPPSVLLGMTFPLMSAAVLRRFSGNPGNSISLLYFSNSIGAAVGALASSFLLVRLVGLPGTVRFAGIINIVLAVTVYFLVKKSPAEPVTAVLAEPQRPEAANGGWYRALLGASFITGTASFIYEIGWIRMLSLVLGSSTHAFELMLSAFIAGLALGGFWIRRRIDQIGNPVRFLVLVQVFMGALALTTLPIYGRSFGVMQWLVTALPKTDSGYALFNFSSHLIALVVMLPATFCAGMTLPLITLVLIGRGHGEKSIGAVYAANTVGAICGVVLAVNVGLPILGLKGLMGLGASFDIALGLALAWGAVKNLSFRFASAVTLLSICFISLAMLVFDLDSYKMAAGVYRYGVLPNPAEERLVFHEDGKTATVSIFQASDGEVNIRTNGKVDASINMNTFGAPSEDEYTMTLLAALPMAFSPQARTAANIGMGAGLTSHTLLLNRNLAEVDTIEIERKIVDGARIFTPKVSRLFHDPRSKIHIEDAKTFFANKAMKYDIIVSEPSNPWVSGVSSLFSREFYDLTRKSLTENGVMVQWLQVYEISTDLLVSVLKSVSESFQDYVIYAADDNNLVLVAKKGGAIADPDPAIFSNPDIAAQLQKIQVRSIQDMEIRKIGDKRFIDRLLTAFHTSGNSDFYPILDQNAARMRFLKANAKELFGLSYGLIPGLETMMVDRRAKTDITPSPFLARSKRANTAMALRDYFLLGRIDSRYGIIPDEALQDAVILKKLFFDCGPVSEEVERISSLYNTAIRIIPFLSRDELDAVWNALESGPCARTLNGTEKRWIHLFKSVGRRDGRTMASTAKVLLNSNRELPENPFNYLVASVMLGSLMLDDSGALRSDWSAYGQRIMASGSPQLLFRLLSAQ